jgi:hypothetical protein
MEYQIDAQGHLIGKEEGAVVDVTRIIHFLADGRGRAALVAEVQLQIPSTALAEVAAQQNVSVPALVEQIMRRP